LQCSLGSVMADVISTVGDPHGAECAGHRA